MDSDYDPHEHREVKRPINNLEAFMDMLKGNLGSGIVALPIAFKHAGWVVGSVGLILCILLTIHTLNTLISTEYRICKRKKVPLLQYSYAMETVTEMGPSCASKCGKFYWYTTFIFTICLQLGACMSYISFGAGVLEAMVNSFLTEEPLTKFHYILITMPPYFCTLFILNLKVIAPLAFTANIATIIGFLLCFRYLFVDLANLIDDRDAFGSITKYPLFIGISIFSMQAVGLITHVEYSMKNPKQFGGLCGMFPLSMYVLGSLYFTIAFFGYWRFGDEVKGNFVLNLPPKDIIPRILNTLFFFSMWVSYGLNAVVPVDMIWEELMEEKFKDKHPFWWHFLLRCIVFIVTYAGVIAIPNISLIITFTGAICMSVLGIIYPILMDSFERYEVGYGKLKWRLIKNIIIIIIGIASFGFGIYSGVLDAIEHRKRSNHTHLQQLIVNAIMDEDDGNNNDEYDPHEYREIKDPINDCEAFMNILRGCLGSGLLVLPIAFKYSGLAIGSVCVVLASILLIHTIDTLIATKHRICQRKMVPLLKYAYAMEIVTEFGPPYAKKCGKLFKVSSFVFIMILQFGNCMSYIIVGASCLETFINSLPGTRHLNRTHCILATITPYFLTLFIMNLKSIAPFSLAANITMLIVLCLSVAFLFSGLGSTSDWDVVASPNTWPISIATVVFSMQAIGVICHVEYSMKTPEHLRGCCGMFHRAMYVVTILNVFVGLFGYWRYGNEVKGNYILNFPPKNIKTRIIQVLLFFTMLVSYGLNAVVAVDIIWDELLEQRITKDPHLWNFLLKAGTVLVTHATTIGLPNLYLVVSLTGAVSICTLGIIYPMLMDLYERYENGYGPKHWILVKDIIIIIIGIACFGMGLSQTILEAAKHGTTDD
ncbi:uncharacterized protein LOC108741409 [Agrilus planipennis]|uniref:Uncharacterized protein LOC108741409 n=1 Tax=Agrilus planipennis TaxID=224129 RepID=A0A1W4X6Q1_AGRPL|nr:uncharacterized protein LOC108741409 [Agrilus planipennis]